MFGKRSGDGEPTKPADAPPPPPKGGPPIATRPQRVEPATTRQALAPARASPPESGPRSASDRLAGTHGAQASAATGGPKLTSAFEQLRAAQGGARHRRDRTRAERLLSRDQDHDLQRPDQHHRPGAAGAAGPGDRPARRSATSSPSWWRSRTSRCRWPSRSTWSRTSSTTSSAMVRSSRCWRATTSPTSWSTAPAGCSSKSAARSS